MWHKKVPANSFDKLDNCTIYYDSLKQYLIQCLLNDIFLEYNSKPSHQDINTIH